MSHDAWIQIAIEAGWSLDDVCHAAAVLSDATTFVELTGDRMVVRNARGETRTHYRSPVELRRAS